MVTQSNRLKPVTRYGPGAEVFDVDIGSSNWIIRFESWVSSSLRYRNSNAEYGNPTFDGKGASVEADSAATCVIPNTGREDEQRFVSQHADFVRENGAA